jgi:type I restriction enzyme S subunit
MIRIPRKEFKIVHTKYRGDYEIPEKWNLERLGSVLKFVYGKGLTEENRSNDGFPVFGSGGKVGIHTKFLKKGPAIIVARKGSLGNVFYTDENFWAIDTVYYITENETKNNLKFLFYLLKYLHLENYAIVTAKPGINRDEIYTIFVRKPTMPEQEKIGESLSNLDNTIEQIEKILEQTRLVKRGLITKLFMKGINHTKFTEKELFPRYVNIAMPESWELTPIKEIADFQPGYAFSSEDYVEKGIRSLKISNVSHGRIIWNEESFLPSSFWDSYSTYQLFKNDIVMAITRPIISTGLKISFFTETSKCLLNQRVGRFIFKKKFDKNYFYYFLNMKYFYDQISLRLSEALQPNISNEEVEKILIWYPSKPSEQEKISTIIQNIDSKINYFELKKSKYLEIKSGLTHKLLTGELRFPLIQK